jgi:long-chain acyl-CoA synthetase
MPSRPDPASAFEQQRNHMSMRITQALIGTVQNRPDALATVDRERRHTWAEVGDRVARGAGVLREQGVRPQARVGILSLNNDHFLELLFAVPWAGAAVVPINTRWALAEIALALRDCQATLLLVDENFVEMGLALAARTPGLRLGFIGQGRCPHGCFDYEVELSRAIAMEDASQGDDELWGIFYTGGTTGHPKGVMLSHTNMLVGALIWVSSVNFARDTRYLHLVGFFHIAAAQPVMALTIVGGTHVIEPKFEAVATMGTIERHRVNFCLFVPTMLNMLLHHPELDRHDLSSVRHCEYGGAPMPDAQIRLAMEKLPTWMFIQGYGQTEAAGLVCRLEWDRHFGEGRANKRNSAGCAAHAIEMRIVDEAGAPVPRGTVGEIAVRGATVMLGYWGQPEASVAALRNGWLHTGDGGYMDDDGFVFIVDRLKDMIVSGGENVFSKEVENAVTQHPAVQDCAVIATPHATWGEAVHAVVVLKAGKQADAASVIAHCRTLIAGFKCPRTVEFRDAMPLSAAGKVQKGILRAELQDRHRAGIRLPT